MLLEVMAEAGRNPKIASLLSVLDVRIRSRTRELLAEIHPHMAESDLQVRAEMWVLLVEGLAMRVTSNPQVDRAALKRGFGIVMRSLAEGR